MRCFFVLHQATIGGKTNGPHKRAWQTAQSLYFSKDGIYTLMQ